MAEAWQSAWVEVLPDFSNFRREAQPSIVSILGGAGNAGGSSGASAFGTSFVAGVSKLALPIAGAFAALGIGNMIGDAVRTGIEYVAGGVDLASDLAESVNAVQVAYGDAADAVLGLGANAADELAITRAELNSFAVQFSSFSNTIAGPGGDVAGTFASIAQRGTDFASVMNLDVKEALGLFQSGLAGETEPLRRYGIDVSAAAVEAYALANGIAASAGSMTEAQKVQARYGLLMQQTNQFAGDFANTSDGLANSQRRFAAGMTEVQTSVGEIFLPLVSEMVNIANDELLPALRDVIAASGPDLAAGIAEAIPSLVTFAQAVVPLIPQLVELGTEAFPIWLDSVEALLPFLTWLAENTNGVLQVATATFALLNGDTSVQKLITDVTGASGVMGFLFTALHDGIAGLTSFTHAALDTGARLATAISGGVVTAVTFVQSLPQRALQALGDLGNVLFNSGRSLIQGFINGIQAMLKPVGDAVSGVLNWAGGFFPNSPAKRGPLAGTGWNKLAESGSAVLSQFISGFERPDLTRALSPVLAAVPGAVSSAYASTASVGGLPGTITLVDADGSILTHARVIAGQTVAANDAALTRASRGRMSPFS